MQAQLFIPVTKNARVVARKTSGAKHLIIALHGYGQLATFFSRHFENLDPQFDYILPEGLHRFYLEGNTGRVGASWMTKEERETDITDNIHYLNTVLETQLENSPYESIRVIGFSQGGATAARWAAQLNFKINQLILWACVFPDDMRKPFKDKTLNSCQNYFVLGDEDPYFTGIQRQEALKQYQELDFSLILYPGSHRIHAETLQHILSNV